MDLKQLRQHIRTLALLEETEAPVVSCYINLSAPGWGEALDEQVRVVGRALRGEEREAFEEATARIRQFLASGLLPGARGAALFARGGASPFFLPLQFQVPAPNWFAANSTPNVYHLVELKDNYHRYVVLISTEESARILEVNLGAVTEELWRERPELRKRVGREWTKEHYQNHRRDRAGQFVKEKIAVLERLMSAGGHTHLILAGNPRLTARVRRALPKHLAAKLVDTVAASGADRVSDVVAATLSSFIEREEMESQAVAELLRHEINAGGLAVTGTRASLNALRHSQVDVLVMAKNFDPDPGRSCPSCGEISLATRTLAVCFACGESDLRRIDVREELTRLAERNGCQVEVVNHSDFLMQSGGVGALLRFLTPEQHAARAGGNSAKLTA